MSKKLELLNRRFGKLQVMSEVCRRRGKAVVWLCLCECGALTEVTSADLSSGGTISCGCHKEALLASGITRTHERSNTRLYKIWAGMKKRCYNPKCEAFGYYGGRGIKVCGDWLDSPESFMKWADCNGYDDKLWIDRYPDKDGDYEPVNCRWTSTRDSAINRRHLVKSNTGYLRAYERKNSPGKFRATIMRDRKAINLGTFDTAEKAARAGDRHIIKMNWPHELNFPELRDENINTK